METRAQISVKNKTSGQTRTFRMDDEHVVLGREASNFIVLEGKTISRRHAEILQEGDRFFVRDLKSNNGTLLNGNPLPTQEKTLLESDDTLQIVDYEIRFHIPKKGEAEDIYETTDTDVLEVKMLKKLLKAMDREKAPSLEVIEGPLSGKRFVLEEKNQDVVIGRDPACEFFIDAEVISRKHARIEKRFDAVILHDLGSRNGVFVNREKVEEKRLQDGDIIHLGTLTLSFRNPQELQLEFEPPKMTPVEVIPISQSSSEEIVDPAPEHDFSQMPEPRSSTKDGKNRRKKKKKEVLPEPTSDPAENADQAPLEEASSFSEPSEEESSAPFKLSTTEMIAIGVGLVVLIGSLWGILKIL